MAVSNFPNLVPELLKKKIDVNKKDNFGNTALTKCAEKGKHIQILLGKNQIIFFWHQNFSDKNVH